MGETAYTIQAKEPIVIIDDDQSICKTLKLHFEREGYEVTTCPNANDGLEKLHSLTSAILILDVRLPDANGVDLLKSISTNGKNYYSIIITAFPDMESTIKAVQNGVGEYIHKPIDIEELNVAVEKGAQYFQRSKTDSSSAIKVPSLEAFGSQFIGKSHAMKEVFKTVGFIAMSKATAHITGESGTGKELVAKAIHQNSEYKDEPFISLNCSAIVDSLLESELFGHEKGSFTGAIAQKEGKFFLAGGGAIFLDEIGEMDINLQAKLLRVLQEREFERVGGKEKLKCSCRIISATNQGLKDAVKAGTFREDLYYRLNVISIHLPPLRERKDDIPELALFFIAKTNRQNNRNIKYITKEAIEFLSVLPWHGNVRQLENFITQTVIMTRDDSLTYENFSELISPEDLESSVDSSNNTTSLMTFNKEYRPRSINEVENEQIRLALSYTNWHKGRACDILGITRPRLERKIKKYGIKQIKVLSGL